MKYVLNVYGRNNQKIKVKESGPIQRSSYQYYALGFVCRLRV